MRAVIIDAPDKHSSRRCAGPDSESGRVGDTGGGVWYLWH